MKEKVAIITGCTSGIGLGIAQSLASKGVNLILNGFGNLEEIEKIRKNMEKEFNIHAIFHAADLSKPSEISDMIKTAIQEFNRTP